MAPFYESSPEKENIAAAINWHAQFPADEMAPAALTFIQKGEKVNRSQLSLEYGQPWIEVSKMFDFMWDMVLITLF
jgi:hypothetical protein